VPAEPTEVYSSMSRSECDERALMLTAVGIQSAIWSDGARFMLSVDLNDANTAQFHLHAYDAERRATRTSAPRVQPATPQHPAWVGSVLYVAVLCGIALAIATGIWPANAFERGELNGAQVHAGQWWRAWTALTLHRDAAHLIGNLGAGVWFGTLAARQLGAGSAWLLIVTGAAAANLFDALLGPSAYRSVGASTAVFTALGLMAAHSWRTRYDQSQRWARRWSPLIAGAVLLGWFGSTGEGTDLVAHALGFGFGCLLGAVGAGSVLAHTRLSQSLAGLAALGSLTMAWALALSR
jgi:rhomboid protease GluP